MRGGNAPACGGSVRPRREACRGDRGRAVRRRGWRDGGEGSAAGRDLLWLLSSSLFGSVDEIDDHSMLRRRAAEGGRGVATGDSGERTSGAGTRAGRTGDPIL